MFVFIVYCVYCFLCGLIANYFRIVFIVLFLGHYFPCEITLINYHKSYDIKVLKVLSDTGEFHDILHNIKRVNGTHYKAYMKPYW